MTNHTNSPLEKRPYIGLGILIVRNNEFLLGKRKGSHGEGLYACPGGHIEWNETIEETARREAFEETGLIIENIRLLSVGNYKYERIDEVRHYVGVDIVCDSYTREPILKEPNKCEGWSWFNINNIPNNIFSETRVMINAYLNGYKNELLGKWN